MTAPSLVETDPFDLPEWLGEGPVTWSATYGIREGHLIHGTLHGEGGELACDLLAVDEAYPAPVADDESRARAHQAWRHGQVLLVEYDDRLTLAVPGTRFDADAILTPRSGCGWRPSGASQDQISVLLRLGAAAASRVRVRVRLAAISGWLDPEHLMSGS